MSLHRADVIREPGCAAQPSDRAADGGDQDHRPRHRKISPRMHCVTTDPLSYVSNCSAEFLAEDLCDLEVGVGGRACQRSGAPDVVENFA